jgi:hypothetical protein
MNNGWDAGVQRKRPIRYGYTEEQLTTFLARFFVTLGDVALIVENVSYLTAGQNTAEFYLCGHLHVGFVHQKRIYRLGESPCSPFCRFLKVSRVN